MIAFTKEQLSEVMCKHAEKENGLQSAITRGNLSKIDTFPRVISYNMLIRRRPQQLCLL